MSNKRISRGRRSPGPSRNRRPAIQPVKRFFRAFSVSAITVFSAVSCALNPQWHDDIRIDPILAQLGVPARVSPVHSPPVSAGLAQTRFAACPQFFPRERAPVVPANSTLRELCFSSFAVLHDGSRKVPVLVAQRLNRKILRQAQGVQRKDRFYAEARLPAAERAELDDYRGSGYSRGHMAPAADMHTADAMAQSFSLANMVPQDQRQNAGPWSEIEAATRRYVMRASGDVFVFTGPVHYGTPATIGDGQVAVPSHLFKVVFDASTGRSWVHWQQNSPDADVEKPISYQDFVGKTGLQLLR